MKICIVPDSEMLNIDNPALYDLIIFPSDICQIVYEEALCAGYKNPKDENGKEVLEKRPIVKYRNLGGVGRPRIEVIEHYRSRSVENYRAVIIFQDENDPSWFFRIEVEKLSDEGIRSSFRFGTKTLPRTPAKKRYEKGRE